MKVFAEGYIEEVFENWLGIILHFEEDDDTYACEVSKYDFTKEDQKYLEPGQYVQLVGETYDDATFQLILSFTTQEDLDAASERAKRWEWLIAA